MYQFGDGREEHLERFTVLLEYGLILLFIIEIVIRTKLKLLQHYPQYLLEE